MSRNMIYFLILWEEESFLIVVKEFFKMSNLMLFSMKFKLHLGLFLLKAIWVIGLRPSLL
jgi:hypothetical protein